MNYNYCLYYLCKLYIYLKVVINVYLTIHLSAYIKAHSKFSLFCLFVIINILNVSRGRSPAGAERFRVYGVAVTQHARA